VTGPVATHLSVNLNAVAQLRNRRNLPWPNVVGIGRVVLEAGAAGLTVHPRPDERHIRRDDVFALKALLREFPGREFNIEGYPSAEFLALCAAVRPDQVTLVPDSPEQSTSDHGWQIGAARGVLGPAIEQLKAQGMRVSLFIDEDPSVPPDAREIGADRVELFTGPYGGCLGGAQADLHLDRLSATAQAARAAGLGLNAGHDLTLDNLQPFIRAVRGVDEVSIGHAITADALLIGFAEAVRRYNQVMAEA
jgi:pyridoxine 5-phosphate synthase